jgi:hypothetical protein
MRYTLRLRRGLACLGALTLCAGSAQATTIVSGPDVTITGGDFDEIILLPGATNFTLTGGTISGDFTALNGTSATISGGDIQGDLLVPGELAVVTLVGSDFTVNGIAFVGDLTADFCTVSGCLIEGTLGGETDAFAIQGYPVRSGVIRLVPEPGAALLLGAGLLGLAFAGRRPRRAPRR